MAITVIILSLLALVTIYFSYRAVGRMARKGFSGIKILLRMSRYYFFCLLIVIVAFGATYLIGQLSVGEEAYNKWFVDSGWSEIMFISIAGYLILSAGALSLASRLYFIYRKY